MFPGPVTSVSTGNLLEIYILFWIYVFPKFWVIANLIVENNLIVSFIFCLCHTAGGILVPRPGNQNYALCIRNTESYLLDHWGSPINVYSQPQCRPTELENMGWGPSVCVIISCPGDSDARKSERITVLGNNLECRCGVKECHSQPGRSIFFHLKVLLLHMCPLTHLLLERT